jgi:predicted secreted protein
MAPLAGFNAVLTVDGNTVGKASDVELSLGSTEVDISTRDGAGWKAFLQGLKEFSATVDQLWVPTDAALQALRDSWLNGTLLAAVFTDDEGNGFSGDVFVSAMSKGEPLDDAVTLNCTLRGTGTLSLVGSYS